MPISANTLEADVCIEAPNEAIVKYGPPEIMNTDQRSQCTSFVWTERLRRSGVRISMDGKGRFLDNIFVERLWRSLKYECVYLHAWKTGSEARMGIRNWMEFYNHKRPQTATHSPWRPTARCGLLVEERRNGNRSARAKRSVIYVEICPNIGE